MDKITAENATFLLISSRLLLFYLFFFQFLMVFPSVGILQKAA